MIREKLSVLLNSSVIDEETYNYVLQVLMYLHENNVISDDSDADIFLTHLAMANMRRKNDETVNKLDEFILVEIENDFKYPDSKNLWENLEELVVDKKFAKEELDYFYLHIINMLREE